jgi:hypothetical protein
MFMTFLFATFAITALAKACAISFLVCAGLAITSSVVSYMLSTGKKYENGNADESSTPSSSYSNSRHHKTGRT